MEKISFRYQQVNKEQIIDSLMEHPHLNRFFLKNDLSSSTIEENLLLFLQYETEINRCLECKGLDECKQDTIGLQPTLHFEDGVVRQYYRECNYQKQRKKILNDESYVDALHMPSSIFEASLDDIDFNRGENKVLVANKLTNFITLYKNGERVNGLYLYGKYGVGKTYVLSALAKELTKMNIKVVIAYYPDLVREFKSKMTETGHLEAIISKLKQIEVLILDDIGGESLSAWVRDEILGPILQYRLLDHKPTFFSSNYSLKELVELHFASFTGSNQKIKAARIGTRIRNLVGENEIKM